MQKCIKCGTELITYGQSDNYKAKLAKARETHSHFTARPKETPYCPKCKRCQDDQLQPTT